MHRLLYFCLLFTLVACSSNPQSNFSNKGENEALYKRALLMDDQRTAIVALNLLLLDDSTNMEYTDSLARIYLRNGIYTGGLLLGDKVMKEQPENYKTLELIAEARGSNGEFAIATKQFNQLFSKFNDIRYLYKLAIIESEGTDLQAFMNRLDQILAHEGTAGVEYPGMQGMQIVDIKAVANLLKANIYFGQGKVPLATEFVKKALAISPDFQAGLVALEQIKSANSGSAKASSQRNLSKKELDRIQYENYIKNNPQ